MEAKTPHQGGGWESQDVTTQQGSLTPNVKEGKSGQRKQN